MVKKATKRNTKSFRSSKFAEEVVLDGNGDVVGTIRIKPTGVLWKPRNAREWYSVSLDGFASWITNPATKAKKTKK